MSITMFMTLFTLGSMAASLLTEAIKKAVKELSTNMIALINAALVGGLGTAGAYVLLDIPFNTNNIVCLALMIVCIWIGSMVGYDKVMQTIAQIKR